MDLFTTLGMKSSPTVMGPRPNTPPVPTDGAPTDPPPTGYLYIVDDAGCYVLANTGFAYRYTIALE